MKLAGRHRHRQRVRGEAAGAPPVTFVGELTGFAGPAGIDRGGADDRYYVADQFASTIRRYELNGDFVDVFVTAGLGGLSFPALIAWHGGDLYVSSFGDSTVKRYSSAGAFLGNFVTSGLGGLSGPTGLLFNGPHLYVASWNNGAVYRYDGTTGAFVDVYVSPGANGLSGPYELFWTGSEILIANGFGINIHRYDPATGFIGTFGSPELEGPVAIEMTPTRFLITMDGTTLPDRVLWYDRVTLAFGGVLVDAGVGGLATPTAAYLDTITNELLVSSSTTLSVLRYANAGAV